METLLELQSVVKHFSVPAGGVVRRRYKTCKAVDDVTFSIDRGACFGIAGESGSGKSTIAKLILRLEELTRGSILYEGKDIRNLAGEDLMWYRSSVQTVFQDAASSLNPRMRIRDIVSEPLEVQRGRALDKKAIHARTEEILGKVGLGPDILRKYPHELSGGQKQRVAIAYAIILEPSLVILDEPVSALDVSIRAQILNLLADIQEKERLTYIIIAHDLAMLQHITTHIAVMYLGKILETGKTEDVFTSPTHPYTKALFAAVPSPTPGGARKTAIPKGEIGNPIDPPPGCRFHPRCPHARANCGQTAPVLCDIGRGHQVACGMVAGISSARA
jgi:oligopeptide/dipeptide ABC transporter ATP-binding protein